MKKIVRRIAVPAALVVGLGGAATAVEVVRTSLDDLQAQSATPAPLAEVPRAAESLATAFRTASRIAMPAVVHVQVEAAPRNVSNRAVPPQLRGTPFEDMFRGRGPMQQGPQMGSGSGFIISPDGYILTNNHVVEQASRVTVVLTDKREFDAEVVGRDPNTDVAVLKINGKNLATVSFGNADDLQIGDWVMALGYPLSLGETATAGIVSAKGRSIGIIGSNDQATAPLEHFIQTDAAINPGNSGGPLVDLQGRVIGINSAIASPTGTYAGYGFAIPVQLAKRVADDLIRYGAVNRPKIGVQIGDVNPADVDVFGLRDARGSVVRSVPAGPAREAGVQLGDVIVGVDGKAISDTGDLMERIALRQPGERITLDLVRYGKSERVKLKLGAFETERAAKTEADTRSADAVGRLGFQVSPVTPQIARELEFASVGGVIIMAVDPAGPASPQLRGLRIQRLNGRQIATVDDVRAAAAMLKPGQTVSIVGLQPDGSQTIINYRLRG